MSTDIVLAVGGRVVHMHVGGGPNKNIKNMARHNDNDDDDKKKRNSGSTLVEGIVLSSMVVSLSVCTKSST